MNSVAQVSNLAQFVRLVSEARTRNNGVSAGVQRNQFAAQPPKARAFSNSQPLSAYSYAKPVAAMQAVDEAGKAHQTRSLGTKFDAYA